MPVVSRRCNGKACGAQMPLKRVPTAYGYVELAMCPKCDALQCDSCGAYYTNPKSQKCPECKSRFGLNTKGKP